MEQLPDAPVVNAVDLASVCSSVAHVDTLLAVDAPAPTLHTCTSSPKSSSIPTSPSCESTSTAAVPTPRNKRSRQHVMNTCMNKRGHTVLMQRAIAGDVRRVRALIDAGADVNVVDDAGLSAVAYAAACGHRDVVRVLLAAKASPVVVSEGIAALVKRVCGGEEEAEDVDVLQVLLRITPMLRGKEYVDVEEEDEDAEEKEEEGTEEIDAEIEGEEDDDVDLDDDEVYEEDTDTGYEDPWSSSDDYVNDHMEELEQPLLYWAAEHGYVDVVKLLLAAGAYMRQRHRVVYDSKGKEDNMNALHVACECGHVEVVKVLLAAGATAIINARGCMYQYGENRVWRDITALHLSVVEGDVEVARVLIAAGADVDVMNWDHATALYLAVKANRMELVRMLLAADTNVHYGYYDRETPLHRACINKNVAMVEMLLAAGADVNAKDCRHETPLHHPSRENAVGVVKLLLAAGADVDVKNNFGMTPLYMALRYVHIVELLLAAGADANVRWKYEYTMLYLAVGYGDVSIVKLLIAAGGDVTATDGKGLTALHIAFWRDDEEMLDALLDPVAFCANMRATGIDNGQ